MTNVAASRWTVEPFQDASAADLARLRDVFVHCGFEEAPLLARAGVDSLHHFPVAEGRTAFREITDAQSLLVHLFIDGSDVPWDAVKQMLSPEDLRVLDRIGFLHSPSSLPDICRATVSIFPMMELHVASDRRFAFDSTETRPPVDLVYPPVTLESQRFLRLMPREPRQRVLDLCSGTGIAALVAARLGGEVTAVDIAERSVRFAAFNARLNGLGNIRAVTGDLYEPVAGETFDLIVAHPPYVPSLETEYVFRDGGQDGEQVTRRILAGLAEHLRPGGQFFCDCMLTEREGVPLDRRIREMFGEASEEFDVVVAQGKSLDPLHFFADQARRGLAPFDRLGEWNEIIKSLAIEQLVFVSMLVQRRERDRPVVTTRRVLSPYTSAADMQWVLRWLLATSAWTTEDTRRLLSSRPRTVPRTELRSRSMLHEGQWSVDECTLITLAPFAVEATCPLWYATLLQFCDGSMTARDHLQYLRDTRAVPDTAPEDMFAMMIRQLVDAGLVEIDEFRLPDETAMRESAGVRERATGGGRVERAD
jgi:SAM-dependent methyltransferase